jgi:hypothetical protein
MSQEQGWVRWVAENWQSVFHHPLFVSLVGSAMAAANSFPGATPRTKAWNGVFSFFIGIYAGPAIVSWRQIENSHIAAAIILGCTLGGLVAMSAALEYLRTTPIAGWPFFRTLLSQPAPPPGGQGG